MPVKELEEISSLEGMRAVIAEDEGITQLQLTKILRAKGLDVVGRASNGQEAVELALQTRPDLVLMDIRMPYMDGLEAAEHILAQERLCIVMLTAFSDEEYRQRAEKLGTSGYVLKPITADTLLPALLTAYQQFNRS